MALSHQPCADCGSSDALMINDDGSTYCFSCGTHHSCNDVSAAPEKQKEMPKEFFKGVSKDIENAVRRISDMQFYIFQSYCVETVTIDMKSKLVTSEAQFIFQDI